MKPRVHKCASHNESEPTDKVSLYKFHAASASGCMKPEPVREKKQWYKDGWGMAGQSGIARTESSARNLGDLLGCISGQESDGAVVALKRVTTVERRAPALKEPIEPRGKLIDGNIYDRGTA